MIVLSAHKDLVMNNYKLEMKGTKYIGLLDNWAGQLLVNSLIIEEPCILELIKQKKLTAFFSSGEEWGLDNDFPELDKKKDIVIVVDVCSGKRYDKFDFAIENIYGISDAVMNNIKSNLKWEGFNFFTAKYNGNPDLEDESFSWVKKGIKVISFAIPIEGESWHIDNCEIEIEKLIKAKQGLKRLINYIC